MDALRKDFAEFKARVSILVNQNAESQAKIVVLENRLSESENKIKELEGKGNTASSSSKNAGGAKNDKGFQIFISRQLQQQKQQIEDMQGEFQKTEKLQRILTGGILNVQKSHERESRVEQITTELQFVKTELNDLQANSRRLSRQVSTLITRNSTDRLENKLGQLQEKVDSLSHKVAAIDHVVSHTFESRLYKCEGKVAQIEGSLNNMHKEMDSLPHKKHSISSESDNFYLATSDEASLNNDLEQMDSITHLKTGDPCFGGRPNDDARNQMASPTHEADSGESGSASGTFYTPPPVWTEKAASWEDALNRLQRQMDTLSHSVDFFDSRLHDCERKNSHFHGRLDDMENQMDTLSHNVALFDSRLHDCEGKNSHFHGRLDDMENQMDTLSHGVDSGLPVDDTVDSRLDECERKNSHFDVSLKDMENQISDLDKSLTLSDEKCNVLEKSIQTLHSKLLSSTTPKVSSAEKSIKALDSRLGKSEENMEGVMEAVDDMQLKIESLASKVSSVETINKNLDSRLANSEGKVENLVSTQSAVDTQMESLTEKVSSVESVNKTLDSRLAKSEGKVENLVSTQTAVDTQVKRCNKEFCTLQRSIEESRIRQEFDSHMKLVRKHKLPLIFDDYVRLASLEYIAEIPNGSAFQALTVHCAGETKHAEEHRQRETEKVRHDSKINTAVEAMTEYVKVVPSPRGDLDTRYYVVFVDGHIHHILAINKSHLNLLSHSTKKVYQHWPISTLRRCREERGQIEVDFKGGQTIKFKTVEKINQDVCKYICSLIGM